MKSSNSFILFHSFSMFVSVSKQSKAKQMLLMSWNHKQYFSISSMLISRASSIGGFLSLGSLFLVFFIWFDRLKVAPNWWIQHSSSLTSQYFAQMLAVDLMKLMKMNTTFSHWVKKLLNILLKCWPLIRISVSHALYERVESCWHFLVQSWKFHLKSCNEN